MRWWKKNDREHDMEKEFASHLELEAEEQRAKGLSVEEARYAAQRAFGNTALMKEQTREEWGWLKLEIALKDVQYGIRGLFRSPIFTIVSTRATRPSSAPTAAECFTFRTNCRRSWH